MVDKEKKSNDKDKGKDAMHRVSTDPKTNQSIQKDKVKTPSVASQRISQPSNLPQREKVKTPCVASQRISQPDTDQLFKGRYRKDSTRLKYWDYGSNAAYFITICTKNRVNYFGEIVDHEMRLTEIGKVAVEEWHKTKELRQDMNIELGDFTVMPNHIHGIIIIGENQYNSKDAMYGVSTDPQPDQSIQDGKGKDAMHGVSAFGPQSKNLSSIIRGYKSSVTIQAKKLNPAFSWQPRYYDHIIRDDRAYENISNYIITNPARWHEDKFFEG